MSTCYSENKFWFLPYVQKQNFCFIQIHNEANENIPLLIIRKKCSDAKDFLKKVCFWKWFLCYVQNSKIVLVQIHKLKYEIPLYLSTEKNELWTWFFLIVYKKFTFGDSFFLFCISEFLFLCRIQIIFFLNLTFEKLFCLLFSSDCAIIIFGNDW